MPTEKPLCALCRRRVVDRRDPEAHGFCRRCRDDYAAARFAPAQRPLAPCRRCQFPQLVRTRLRHIWGELRHLAPLAAAHPVVDGRLHRAPDRDAPAGVFEAYICRACGFTDLYCTNPAAIPIGPEHGTELVDADPDRIA
jgi:hypothetical protein